jgi:hypothetical protein
MGHSGHASAFYRHSTVVDFVTVTASEENLKGQQADSPLVIPLAILEGDPLRMSERSVPIPLLVIRLVARVKSESWSPGGIAFGREESGARRE